MSFELKQGSLKGFLKEQGFTPLYDENSEQISINLKIGGYEVPLFFVIREEGKLLQTIAYLPFILKKEYAGEVGRVLHLLNKELDMPGFGMDETQGLLFYRSVIPCPEGVVDKKLLRLMIATSQIAVDTFMHSIGRVATGMANIESFLKKEE